MKNLPTWERLLRIAVGAAAIVFGLTLAEGVWGTVLALSAAGIVLSGLAGFCPMCALVGRRLDRQGKSHGAS